MSAAVLRRTLGALQFQATIRPTTSILLQTTACSRQGSGLRSRSNSQTNGFSIHTTSMACSKQPRRPPSNPWSVARAAEKRERVKKRKEELRLLRQSIALDPVTGLSLAGAARPKTGIADSVSKVNDITLRTDQLEQDPDTNQRSRDRFNHFLQPDDVARSLQRSKELEERPSAITQEKDLLQGKEFHSKATAAMHRILSLGNGSSVDRTRANKTWCIDTFGRHHTDTIFQKSKHPSAAANPAEDPIKTPRVGPDVGSSEVQAAILTIKIRALAKQLETHTHDKMNKRNLRLMVHRRQKLLKYLRRKERGGERYRNVMDSLGLDDTAIMREVMM